MIIKAWIDRLDLDWLVLKAASAFVFFCSPHFSVVQYFSPQVLLLYWINITLTGITVANFWKFMHIASSSIRNGCKHNQTLPNPCVYCIVFIVLNWRQPTPHQNTPKIWYGHSFWESNQLRQICANSTLIPLCMMYQWVRCRMSRLLLPCLAMIPSANTVWHCGKRIYATDYDDIITMADPDFHRTIREQ